MEEKTKTYQWRLCIIFQQKKNTDQFDSETKKNQSMKQKQQRIGR